MTVLNTANEPIFLWDNMTVNTDNCLKIELEGTTSNRMGIDSKIKVIIGDDIQYAYTLCGEGYIAQNSQREFFGLGQATQVDAVGVQWLSGQIDRLEDVAINQTLKITEGQNPLSAETPAIVDFQLYSNPVANTLQLTTAQTLVGGELTVYDMLGKRILKQKL